MSRKIILIFICLAAGQVKSTHSSLDGLFDTTGIDDSEFAHDFNIDGETDTDDAKSFEDKEVRAVTVLRGYGKTIGLIHLVQSGKGETSIYGTIAGLRPFGKHGFHVHEHSVSSDCESAGEHYNPTRQQHGSPQSIKRHVGDLGNVEAGINGIAQINLSDDQISLVGPYSVIGRSLVVHLYTDDLGNGGNRESKRTGNSGGRLACGTIRFVHIK